MCVVLHWFSKAAQRIQVGWVRRGITILLYLTYSIQPITMPKLVPFHRIRQRSLRIVQNAREHAADRDAKRAQGDGRTNRTVEDRANAVRPRWAVWHCHCGISIERSDFRAVVGSWHLKVCRYSTKTSREFFAPGWLVRRNGRIWSKKRNSTMQERSMKINSRESDTMTNSHNRFIYQEF